MKRIVLSCMMLMATSVMFGQTALELARQQQELEAFNKKVLNAKPSKDAKKEAKKLEKEGWTVPAGEMSIERQVTKSQLYVEELMTAEDGSITKRFLMHTAQQTSGTYNVGYAAARANALAEVASMIKTQLVMAVSTSQANSQTSAVEATTVDKFNQKIDAIVDQTLANGMPMLSIYRRLPNGNFEVQVRLAFDKKDIMARMKKNMQKELGAEGEAVIRKAQEAVQNNL